LQILFIFLWFFANLQTFNNTLTLIITGFNKYQDPCNDFIITDNRDRDLIPEYADQFVNSRAGNDKYRFCRTGGEDYKCRFFSWGMDNETLSRDAGETNLTQDQVWQDNLTVASDQK